MALTPAQVAAKWKMRASGSGSFYSDAVKTAGPAYDAGVAVAEPAYEQGVQEAIGRKAWGKRTNGKGSKYANKAGTKGATNWTNGINQGEADFLSGATPFLELGQHLTLPPAGSRGSIENQQRSIAAQQQFRALKLSRQG